MPINVSTNERQIEFKENALDIAINRRETLILGAGTGCRGVTPCGCGHSITECRSTGRSVGPYACTGSDQWSSGGASHQSADVAPRYAVGVAAAVANAVFHATGVRIRELPIRLEHLL
ncbi:hypothetical protein [Paramesorhizobium deserti]|uniref:hypothetical protein n=1 Tax=Paramesorhizobium deserti TaxID=1494590 RepID=UPI000AA83D04|nr:hypothetical protein [Paramesorhizobium deserti]